MGKKALPGLAHNLVHSYCSTLYFYDYGYMPDWLFNLATHYSSSKITIDLLPRCRVMPEAIDHPALRAPLPELLKILGKTLNWERVPPAEVSQVSMEFTFPNAAIRAVTGIGYIRTKDGRTWAGRAVAQTALEEGLFPRYRSIRLFDRLRYRMKILSTRAGASDNKAESARQG